MKIFHLSDLHIGLKLMNHDLFEDQMHVFDQIVDYAVKEQPDAIVIAGDIYDKALPGIEAVEMFDAFTLKLSKVSPHIRIMMISGNHDSAPRVNVYREILKENRIYMIGQPPRLPEEHMEQVTLKDDYGDVHFYLLPFVKPSMVKQVVGTDDQGNNLSYDETIRKLIQREHVDTTARNVFVSHQFYLPVGAQADQIERAESEIRVVGNIDEVRADVLKVFDYAALGHIHKPMKVGSEYYRYCGTPLACSVSEAGQSKGIIMVELAEKGTVRTSVLPLYPKRQVRTIKGAFEDLLKSPSEDYVRIMLTDQVDLDVFDMQARLKVAFPNYLEITRVHEHEMIYDEAIIPEKEMDPYELCKAFLNQVTEAQDELLQDVINTVQGGF